MAARLRSPFGELVFTYRNKLSLSQPALSERAMVTSNTIPDGATLSARTIYEIERRRDDPAQWHVPRLPAVNTLAAVFGLAPGTPEHDEFFAAATLSVSLARKAASGADDGDDPTNLFVEAGREPHLARLRREVESAVAKRAGVVFVSADPGTGKSSLITEICREAVERHPALVTLWGHSPEQGEFVPSHEPFRQVLRLMVGDLALASPGHLISTVNESRLASRAPVAARALASDGRGLINRALGDEALWNDKLAGALDAEQLRNVNLAIHGVRLPGQEALSACEQFFRVLARYATSGPVLLVLEDVHWADTGTIESIMHLVQRLHQQRLPVLLIGSFRPGQLGPTPSGERHPLPAVIQGTSRLFLDPIVDLSTAVGGTAGRAFIDAYLQRFFPGFPHDEVDALFHRTGGLPLYVSGLVRMHEQDKTLAGSPDSGAKEDDDRVDSSHIPAEIETLFSGQMDQLAPELQELLRAASVQGAEFSAELLMQVLGHDRPTLIDMVAVQLVRRYRLLVPGGSATIAGDTVHLYQFSHALFRDYILDRMEDVERRHYHALTADALLALYGDEGHDATDAIAWHLDQANDPARAGPAYLRAGVHAMILRAYRRAILQFERIQQLPIHASDPVTYVHSFVGLGNCARGQGNAEEAHRMLEQAITLAQRHHLPVVQAHALESMAMLDFDAGDMHAGAQRLETAIGIFLDSGIREDAARAMANRGYLLYGLGRYEDAIAMAEQGRAMAVQVGNDRTWVDARNAHAICLIDLGRPSDAMTIYRECLDVCVEIEDAHREHLCWLNVSLAAFEMEQWEIAKDAVDRVLAGPGHTSRLVGAAEFNAGVIAEGMRDMRAARSHYQASREIREGNGQEALMVDSLAGLLRVAVSEGDAGMTRSLRADIAHRIESRGLDGIEHPGRLFTTLIRAALAQDDREAARGFAMSATTFVRDRANRLHDPAVRQGYLTKVTAHRRIAEMATALEIGELTTSSHGRGKT